MSESVAFDTHRFVKHLTANGFTEQQAEALAVAQVGLLDSNLATKVDIANVQRDIEALRSDLLIWMFGALIAQGALIVTLVKLL